MPLISMGLYLPRNLKEYAGVLNGVRLKPQPVFSIIICKFSFCYARFVSHAALK